MKRLWIELQRWNKQRVITCRTCGPLRGGRRMRAPIAQWHADCHEWEHFKAAGNHRVRVSRCG